MTDYRNYRTSFVLQYQYVIGTRVILCREIRQPITKRHFARNVNQSIAFLLIVCEVVSAHLVITWKGLHSGLCLHAYDALKKKTRR